MSRSIAARALAQLGDASAVAPLAAGMSSSAWTATLDGQDVVIRVPHGDGRRPTPRYDREHALLDQLHADGARVAPCRLVRVGDVTCSVAPRVPGRPARHADWTNEFVADVAATLATLHDLDPRWAVENDLVARFHLARIWPFDGTPLADHPVATLRPDCVTSIQNLRDSIMDAASPLGVAHTDLHPDHLLVGDDGRLAAVLDFGDAVAAAPAWDLAALRYYHGRAVADRVTAAFDELPPADAPVDLLTIAFVLYKLAKTPERPDVIARVEPLLDDALAGTA